MKYLFLFCSFVLVFIVGIGIGKTYFQDVSFTQPISETARKITQKPLEKYSFETLSKTNFAPSVISLGDPLNDSEKFSSYKFYYVVDGKKVSGLLNFPKKAGTYPIIVLFRGYVDKEAFTTGEGTRRTAEYLAENGFVTLAPDFLGYGDSEEGSQEALEDRFQTYPTALTLLSSLSNVNKTLEATQSGTVQINPEKVGIWGHSNGGHIAFSVLAITKKPYPTVLWNPVSKPFPYSILYFTDEYDDHGKGLRKILADFEKDYDIEKFSPTRYYKNIDAPIQLHQAVLDDAVPIKWSNQLYAVLTDLDKEITYETYPVEDHNFTSGSWPVAVKKTSDFFREKLEK